MIKATGAFGRSRLTAQLMRYFIVGVSSNDAGYLLYLLITHFGMDPKVAMTLLYAVGATLGFVGNRRFTFGNSSKLFSTGASYILAHCFGYLLNLSIQIVVVDRLGYPHQLGQAIGICVVAFFLFVALKYCVFVNRLPMPEGQP